MLASVTSPWLIIIIIIRRALMFIALSRYPRTLYKRVESKKADRSGTCCGLLLP